MKILVTNDDGIFAAGLWALVQELKTLAQVLVVAPLREQSAIGTAVTLFQPLRTQETPLPVPGVETHSVDGTPADCVLMALGKLSPTKIDLVISGINHGPNLGDDVFISGTVSAGCSPWKEIGIPFEAKACPKCGTTFKYIGTRISKATGELKRIREKRPDLTVIDYNDFKEILAREKARGIF